MCVTGTVEFASRRSSWDRPSALGSGRRSSQPIALGGQLLGDGAAVIVPDDMSPLDPERVEQAHEAPDQGILPEAGYGARMVTGVARPSAKPVARAVPLWLVGAV